MASLTVKHIPDRILESLRARAEAERRSLNQELIYLLEKALAGPAGEAPRWRDQMEAQTRAWKRLAGRWASERETSDEVHDILDARSGGRSVDL